MVSAISLLTFGLQMTACQTLVCTPPFGDIHGVCLHVVETKMTYCDAQNYCWSLGGELVRGNSFLPLDGKTFPGAPYQFWIGLTDLLIERRLKRSGRRWSDGAVDPPSSALTWRGGNPHTASEDCTFVRKKNLRNNQCNRTASPMCQPRSNRSSTNRYTDFQAVAIPTGLPEEEFAEAGGCSKLLTNVESEIECAALCSGNDSCVSFYFNKAKRECRLVLFTDATIDMGDARGWMKFVTKK